MSLHEWNLYDAMRRRDEPTEPRGAADSAPLDPERASRYAAAAIESECAAIHAAPIGERNETLNRAGFSLAQLVAAQHIDEQTVREQLTQAATWAGLPPGEIEGTLRSSLGAGMKQPRIVADLPPTPAATVLDGGGDGGDRGGDGGDHRGGDRRGGDRRGGDRRGGDRRGGDGGDGSPTVAGRLDPLDVEREAYRLRIREAAREKVAAEKAIGAELPPLSELNAFLAVADEDVSYRIAGVWPSGGRVVLSAPHKAGKTTLLANVLRSLADGVPLLDSFGVEAAQRIVLIDNELDERMLRRWLREQSVRHVERIAVLSLRGRLSAFNIMDAATRARWADHIGDADVLLFDCLRPALDALALSEDKDAGRFLEALDELATEAGIAESLIVHHMGHTGERSRGDSRLLDWPDAVWKLVTDTDTDDEDSTSRRVYFAAYGRDVDVSERLLHFDANARRLSVAGGSRHDARIDTALSDVLAMLRECSGSLSGREIEEWRHKHSEHSQKAVREALKRGTANGQIITTKGPRNATLHRAD